MADETAPIDLASLPELAAVVEELCRTGQPRRIRRAGQDVALLSPLPRRDVRGHRAPASPAGRLWDIVGARESAAPDDIATDKHTYLADTLDAGCEPPEA